MAWKDGLKGVLGALLGALGCVLLSWAAAGLVSSASLLVTFFAGPLAMAGYRRCKGLKNRRFAYAVTGIFTLLASVLSPVVAAAAYRLEPGIFLTILTPAYWAKAWIVHLYMSGLAMLVFWGHRGKLQVYIDPSLGPRYEAGKYAGGLMYNMCPMQLAAQAVPRQFYVGGKLEVDGARLRTVPALRKGRTFSVGEIAGVVLGRSTGSNVLYDKDHQVLAKFAWSMGNADLLFLYLLEHNVKFDNLPPELAVYGQPPTGS